MTCKHGLQTDECAYCTGLIKQASESKSYKRLPPAYQDFIEFYQDSFYVNDEWGISIGQMAFVEDYSLPTRLTDGKGND